MVCQVLWVIETGIIFLRRSLIRSFHRVGLRNLGVVVIWVRVLHVASTLDHGKLLQVLIVWVRWNAHVPPLGPIVVAHLQVWQLFLRFPKLVMTVLFGWIYSWNFALLIILCRQVTAASKLVWVLAVLAKRVSKIIGPHRLLSHSVLLLQHLLLLFNLSKPGVLKGLRSCYSVIRVVHQQLYD